MEEAGKKFLYELLTTPAPTGNELQVQSLLSKRLGPVAERFVQPGDYATYKRGVTELKNGYIASPGLDDRAGLFVVAEAFRRCSELDLKIGLVAVSTVQEEVGMRGAGTAAFSIQPEVA